MALQRGVERTIATSQEMHAFGRELAAGLEAGAVLALVGGLGAGKTQLSKGLAEGLGHDGEVTSPTFSLVQEYRGGRLPMLHFDLYRLRSEEELLGIGWDEYLDQPAVVVVEWADLFPALMPAETRWLRIDTMADGGRRVSG